MNGYLRAMRRYADFRGRASRAEFWGFEAFFFVALVIAILVDGALFTGPGRQAQPVTALVTLVHFLPNLAVSVRRLHDTDKSGWLLLVSFIPLVGIVLMIVWACQGGTAGANRFGLDPRGGSGAPSGVMPMAGAQPRRDVIAEVERLAQLKANGSLTEAEFEVMKAQALGRS